MENYQQPESVRNASSTQENNHVETQRPGQVLPAEEMKETGNSLQDENGEKEQHSESSLPQEENETLGTP